MRNGPYELVIAPANYPGKKYRDRYCYEHTFVYWKHTGTLPPAGQVIHHINGDRRDNRIENLKLLTPIENRKENARLRLEKSEAIICGFCGKEFRLLKSRMKTRLKLRKFNKLFCSSRCGARHQHKALAL